MKGIEWGLLYNTYKDAELDPDALEAAITRLMADDDVSNKKGIYTYILNGDERNLSIRPFSDTQKREAYERQKLFQGDYLFAVEVLMKLTKIKIQNYRCFGEEQIIDFDDLTAFIGNNCSGKTTAMSALNCIFFK